MPKGPKQERVHFDSCVFLSLIEGMPGRANVIEALIDECRANEREVITSAIAIAEVAFARSERDSRSLDPSVERVIDDLWAPGSPFTVVEFYPELALEARDLVRSSLAAPEKTLAGADAIHLATALRFGATHLYTYDKGFRKYRPEGSIVLTVPQLRTPLLGGPEPAAEDLS